VRLPRLFRTSSFRLTLVYAALFSASVLVLFGAIYWSTNFYMTNQLEAAVDSDLTELQEALRTGGVQRLATLIQDRVGQMPAGPILYLLEDGKGRALAGNLPSLPPKLGIVDLELPGLGARGRHVESVHGRGVMLPGGDYLLVGADAYPLNEMREVVLRAFGVSFAVTLLLAFGGGVVMSGSLLRRVETIGRTAREIMEGNISRRVPMRGADDEFDHLAESLNAMLDRTESSIEGMRQISNDIAHDLRTPLTRLRQRLELGQRKAASIDELRSVIHRSLVDADGILETFGALLSIAQIESGVRKERFAEIDLTELLHSVVELYQPMAEEKHQTLTVEIAPKLIVRGDRELLAQMFANLIENAMRHSPAGASIGVAAATTAEAAEVVVADNGPGIPATEHSKVFRRFYRLETSRTTLGSGLGLSLVAAVAALHDVAVELGDNKPGLRVRLRFSGGVPHASDR
jgi:signal transduction histidine kinase